MLFEYLLIVEPSGPLRKLVLELKGQLKKEIKSFEWEHSAPHITVLNWGSSINEESRIIENIRRSLKHITKFDLAITELSVWNKGSTFCLTGPKSDNFVQLCKAIMNRIKPIIRSNGAMSGTFHSTIGKIKIGQTPSEKFTRQPIPLLTVKVENVLLLRREPGKFYKVVEKIAFGNDPATPNSQSGQLDLFQI